jgi:farnesyl diphosphate synthase
VTARDARASDAVATDLESWLAETREWIERELERRLAPARERAPAPLGEALAYAALGGGKRLPASLVRLVGAACGATDDECARPAVAVELIHAYSLVHDDLPCMDDDDWRRGRASCHVRFGESNALLAGDALQALAFEVLAGSDPVRAVASIAILSRAAGRAGMVGGQVLDLSLSGESPDLESVARMHAMKTGALIAASAELGAVAALATPHAREAAREWGEAVGRCFQAVDDLLDVTSDKKSLGKTPGKDAAQRKPTLVAALGLDGARSYAARQAEAARRLAQRLGGERELAVELVDWLSRRRS